MKQYIEIVKDILENGIIKRDRTGIGTLSVIGKMFKHDMEDGFPLLTSKRVPIKLVASELEMFMKGITDKRWLHERDNHIWDEWCTPAKVPYSHDPEQQQKMLEEPDLGPIYGFQWRRFGMTYRGIDHDYTLKTPLETWEDQFQNLLHLLKTDPTSRRMVVSSWNPLDLNDMALMPCHYCWQVLVENGRLNLLWNQRSVDVALGLPFNIASYALLLSLLAKEAGYIPGKLVGFLADTHIYLNHISGMRVIAGREPKDLPSLHITNWNGIENWKYTDIDISDYNPYKGVKFDIAV